MKSSSFVFDCSEAMKTLLMLKAGRRYKPHYCNSIMWMGNLDPPCMRLPFKTAMTNHG